MVKQSCCHHVKHICWLIDWLWYSFGLHYCVLSLSTGIKEVTPESIKAIFGEIHTSIDTLAFTFGNVWVLCLWSFSTQVSIALVKKRVDFSCLTLVNTFSWISVSALSVKIWHLDICLPEFLTSLWEMWTAAQGWGPPRPGEAGWALLFQSCAVKRSSFQKSKLKARYYYASTLKDTCFLYLIEVPQLRLPLMSDFICMSAGPVF